MRRTHSFELVGIGNFDEFPARVKDKEYPCVNKQGQALVKKVIAQGNSSEYAWFDANGKTYSKEEVFWSVNGKLVQKVNRTEKVSVSKLVPKEEAFDMLELNTSFLLPQNETTLNAFRAAVPQDQALKFAYKKSSVGFKWVSAFVFELNGELCLLTGSGKRSEAMEQFKSSKAKAIEAMPETVEVSADEVAPDLD